MNSSARWVENFIEALECVRCRTKDDLTLFTFDKKPVIAEHHTLEDLHNMVFRMDVWCPKCAVTFTTRVTGPVRLQQKQDAAQLADIKTTYTKETFYDTHVIDGEFTLTKHQLLEQVKDVPCAVCEKTFPTCAMDCYHIDDTTKKVNITTMLGAGYTILQFINELEKCCVVCAVCHRLITHGLVDPPQKTIDMETFLVSNHVV